MLAIIIRYSINNSFLYKLILNKLHKLGQTSWCQATGQRLSYHFKLPSLSWTKHLSKNSGIYSTALWSSVCLHLSIEWGTRCTGKNAGNQETSSIPGLPLTSHVASDKSFCSFSPQLLHLFDKGVRWHGIFHPFLLWHLANLAALRGQKSMRAPCQVEGTGGKAGKPLPRPISQYLGLQARKPPSHPYPPCHNHFQK